MAFTTYAGLVDAITKWLNRDNDADMVARIPDFIALGEARIRRNQEWFEQVYSLTNAGLPLSINAHPMVLPNHVRDIKAMWAATSLYHRIELLTPAAWRDFVALDANATGIPVAAVLIPQMDAWMVDPDDTGILTRSGSYLYLWPRPLTDSSFKVDFDYIRDLDALTVGTVNGLYLRHPDLYLYAALCESAPYLQHDERLPMWEARYTQAMSEINIERERAKYSTSRKRPTLPRSF